LRRYKAKGVKTRCYHEGVGQFERRFQGKGSSLGNIFLVSTKLDTFLQTDGIAIARTALAKRRAVKSNAILQQDTVQVVNTADPLTEGTLLVHAPHSTLRSRQN